MHYKTNFADNKHGKLLPDVFITVRPHDGGYRIGQSREICLRHQKLGIGEVMSITSFSLKYLPDAIAFPAIGGNAEKLKKFLYNTYKDIDEETVFDVVVIRWTVRPPRMQEDIFKNFYSQLEENYQPSLFA